jgi:xanthine/CO dehydrogenase XdhC/CoxF family maturation factor
LLSGGCLESDLQEHALLLLRGDARCMVKTYDSRGSDDPVWGLGLGCEGLMQILLLRVDQSTSWEPLASLFAAERERRTASVSIDIHTGAVSTATSAITGLRDNCFTLVAEKPPALLICGAGPDAEPVAALAALLDWQVTVVDHRPAYIDAGRFPKAVRLIQVEASKLAASVTLDDFDAAVVMSHHLIADGRYLGALARSSVPYVGLLGPAARRERLIAELGEAAKDLRVRLRAPVGLDLGGRSPEAIALSIVAEIQAVVHSRPGMPFSAVVDR